MARRRHPTPTLALALALALALTLTLALALALTLAPATCLEPSSTAPSGPSAEDAGFGAGFTSAERAAGAVFLLRIAWWVRVKRQG